MQPLNETQLSYGTERQQEIGRWYIDNGFSIHATAKHFSVSRSAARKAIRAMVSKATKHGYSPEHDMTHHLPDGQKLRGVSVMID